MTSGLCPAGLPVGKRAEFTRSPLTSGLNTLGPPRLKYAVDGTVGRLQNGGHNNTHLEHLEDLEEARVR